MHSRVAVQVLTRPVPRLLAEQFRPSTKSAFPAWTRPISRLRASSICFRCSVQAQSQRQYATSGTPPREQPPKQPEQEPKAHTSPASTSPDSSSSTSTSSSSPNPETPNSQEGTSQEAHDPSLPSTAESSRSPIQARFSHLMDTLQTRFMTASQTLNDLTGYTSIEKIKLANEALESQLALAQSRLRSARSNYKSLVSHRASTQREVNTLLARKDTWSPSDVERFTTLYRSEHELEGRVQDATRELTEAESEELRVSTALTTGILRRYHEEQIWSDRIRRQSTWGTWGLMGVNVLLFIGLQVFGEPWKRRKLVERFVDAERGVWEDVRREVGDVRSLLEGRDKRGEEGEGVEGEGVEGVEGAVAVVPVTGEETVVELTTPGEASAVSTTEMPPLTVEEGRDWRWWREVILDPGRWRAVVEDLYSERRIDLRMRDASILALEGAVAGASVAAGVLFLVLRR